MPVPGSRNESLIDKVIVKQGGQVISDGEVEWYSGSELYTHPQRLRINDVWEDVFHFDKTIEEDEKGHRNTVFRCHIGDNRVIIVLVYAH